MLAAFFFVPLLRLFFDFDSSICERFLQNAAGGDLFGCSCDVDIEDGSGFLRFKLTGTVSCDGITANNSFSEVLVISSFNFESSSIRWWTPIFGDGLDELDPFTSSVRIMATGDVRIMGGGGGGGGQRTPLVSDFMGTIEAVLFTAPPTVVLSGVTATGTFGDDMLDCSFFEEDSKVSCAAVNSENGEGNGEPAFAYCLYVDPDFTVLSLGECDSDP